MTRRNDDIELLFKANYTRMHRLAVALLHDSNEASDVVHEVFSALIREDLTGTTPGYLLAAVRNRCMNIIRKADTRRRLTELYLLPGVIDNSDDWPPEEIFTHINEIIFRKTHHTMPARGKTPFFLRIEIFRNFSTVRNQRSDSLSPSFKCH